MGAEGPPGVNLTKPLWRNGSVLVMRNDDSYSANVADLNEIRAKLGMTKEETDILWKKWDSIGPIYPPHNVSSYDEFYERVKEELDEIRKGK